MRYQAALRPDFLQSYPTRPHDSRRWREWRLGSETGAKMLAELRRNSCTGTQAGGGQPHAPQMHGEPNWARRASAKACALAECRASGEKIPEDLPLCCLDGQRDAQQSPLAEWESAMSWSPMGSPALVRPQGRRQAGDARQVDVTCRCRQVHRDGVVDLLAQAEGGGRRDRGRDDVDLERR